MKRVASMVAVAAAVVGLSACAVQQGDAEPLSGPTYERALALLRTESHSPDAAVRANCIEALQASRDPRAMEVIEEGLHDKEWVVRFAAAMAAGKRRADSVRPVLNTMVTNDPNRSVRAACIYALRRLGDSTHMSDLSGILASDDPEARANTALVLGLIGDPSAIPLLQSERAEPDIRVRVEITAAMARLGDPSAQQVIVSWAVNRFAEDQWSAMTVCADLPPEIATSPLQLGLQDFPRLPANMPELPTAQVKDLTVRRQLVAARSLAKLRNGEGVGVALDNLDNPNANLRALAALALGDMLNSRQAPGLEKMLADADVRVQQAAAAAIVAIYARANQSAASSF